MNDLSPVFYTFQPANTLRKLQIQLWIQKLIQFTHDNKQLVVTMNSEIFRNEKLQRTAEPRLIKSIFNHFIQNQLGVKIDNGIQIQLLSIQEGYVILQKLLNYQGRQNDILDYSEIQELIQDSQLSLLGEYYILQVIQQFISNKRCEKIIIDQQAAYKFCDILK
ncbi:ESCRT-II complex subunit-containing protein [Spironucleus salmonicida]|uniref:ESCRT-II complex subunit-containing protein n=1 Tax=Spironucleus salmonicida TaxID=348837 RepID=V6LHE8_9EUKA|nr:ESCRT-II complex subunit-containing protein [Spironucleus salmonicida]|eukprot:EST43972.1 ESCRT-II complex subunit-containing protein [Spironucleus salmonicida]